MFWGMNLSNKDHSDIPNMNVNSKSYLKNFNKWKEIIIIEHLKACKLIENVLIS